MKVEIEVTTDDIRLGCRGENHACPIARAICRALRLSDVYVAYDLVFLYKGYCCKISLPQICSTFIDDFDAHREVKPFKFFLEI